MGRGIRRQAPALVVACVALVAALGGSVYAAQKIDGRDVRAKSLPGNRVAPGSLPGNRLKPGAIGAKQLAPGSVSGAQIDAATLGEVPAAAHANSADSAREAQTALNAINALETSRINGYSAGCKAPTRNFAGACWQSESSTVAVSAPEAAVACASQGGELPSALALVAFTQQPGINLAAEGEWTGDIPVVSGPGMYAVVTVSQLAVVSSALATDSKRYRCVLPLVR